MEKAERVPSPLVDWVRAHALPIIAALAACMLLAVAIRAKTATAPRDLSVELPPLDIAAVRAENAGPPGEAPHGRLTVAPPAFVKGIYVSAAAAGSKNMFAGLVNLVDATELNAMVIDIKEGGGELAFIPDDPELALFSAKRPSLGHLKDFTTPLHEKGIYLIARLFVFQDPSLVAKRPEVAVHSKATGGIWRDRKGVTWIDPADQKAWDYTVKVAREAYASGFDEIQLDYVRFPTDGVMTDMAFPVYDGKEPKSEVMRTFFTYFNAEMAGIGARTSVDLFGLTMWQHDYDLNIGQRLDVAAPLFDFISPMVYPSHYPNGFDGHANPANYPYDVVYKNLVKGQPVLDAAKAADPDARIATIRPWIQDFDLGADYDAAKVRAQMQASEDGKASGWLLWNARNVYTVSALKPAPPSGQ